MLKKILLIFACLGILISGPAFASAKTNHVQAVVFDFGGVVAQTNKPQILSFLDQWFQFSEDELKYTRKQWKEALREDADDRPFWNAIAQSRNITLPDDWHDEFSKVRLPEANGETLAILHELHSNGYSTPLLSNVNDYQANILRKTELYDLFDPLFLSYELGVEKPNPEIYAIMLDRLNLLPMQVVFIDDNENNVEAARELGIDAIHFTSAYQLGTELQKRSLIKRKIFFAPHES